MRNCPSEFSAIVLGNALCMDMNELMDVTQERTTTMKVVLWLIAAPPVYDNMMTTGSFHIYGNTHM